MEQSDEIEYLRGISMKDDMKQYKDVWLIISEQSKPATKANKLLKVLVNTEDEILGELIDRLVECYKRYIVKGHWIDRRYPSNRSEWLECYAKIKNETLMYIESILEKQKPQWQILAERNGWAYVGK